MISTRPRCTNLYNLDQAKVYTNLYHLDQGVQICIILTRPRCTNLYDLDQGVQICTIVPLHLEVFVILHAICHCTEMILTLCLKIGTLAQPERHWRYEIQETGENSSSRGMLLWFHDQFQQATSHCLRKKDNEGLRMAIWLNLECSGEFSKFDKQKKQAFIPFLCILMCLY